MSSNRSDIDINDPEFWEKWARKADFDPTTHDPQAKLIIHEPRQRRRRFDESVYRHISEDDVDGAGGNGAAREDESDTSSGMLFNV